MTPSASGDADRDHADFERDARAEDDAREHVAPQIVRAEQMLRGRRLGEREIILRVRVVRREQRGEERTEDDDCEDAKPDPARRTSRMRRKVRHRAAARARPGARWGASWPRRRCAAAGAHVARCSSVPNPWVEIAVGQVGEQIRDHHARARASARRLAAADNRDSRSRPPPPAPRPGSRRPSRRLPRRRRVGPICRPMIVTIGMKAFFSACRTMTRRSPSPFARAVAM